MNYLQATNKINNHIEYTNTDLKITEIHPVNTSNINEDKNREDGNNESQPRSTNRNGKGSHL